VGLARAAGYDGSMKPPRFQFRLRTLMMVVTAWAVLLTQWPLVEWDVLRPHYPNLMANEEERLPKELWTPSYYVPERVWRIAAAEAVAIAGWQLLALLRRRRIEITRPSMQP
jgi:hypothetical protein